MRVQPMQFLQNLSATDVSCNDRDVRMDNLEGLSEWLTPISSANSLHSNLLKPHRPDTHAST